MSDAVGKSVATQKKKPRHYTKPEVELGLAALAVHLGNTRQAHKSLKARGTEIPAKTLERWKRSTHVERYREVRAELAQTVKAEVAEEARSIARDALEGARELVAGTRKEQGEIPARDLPGAARNLSVSAGILLEKANLYDDGPTHIVKHDLSALLRQLKDRGLAVDVEVEEITDAEVVEEPPNELEAA